MLNKVLGLIRLLRPVNCLMMGLAVLIGEIIVYRTLYFAPSILGFVTAFTLAGASMISNDYWDMSVDVINVPHRPIASGLISVRLALSCAFILMVIGLSSAILTNTLSFLIAIFSLAISLLYSYRGKTFGLIGNFMVSACISIPLFYGGFVYAGANLSFHEIKPLLIFDLMVFLANTGREVNKGIVDIEGDQTKKVRTVAVLFGSKIAAVVSALFYLSAIALSVLPWSLSLTSLMYLPLVVIADVGFLVSSFILLRDNSKKSAMRIKKMVLIWMCIGLLAFVTGALVE